MARSRSVVVVGGGASGALTAAALLRRGSRVVLVERRARCGPGVAYDTRCDSHLLNVPAGRMSALPEEPGHFADWAAARHPGATPVSFLPRRLYGEYLEAVLVEAATRPGADLDRLSGEAVVVRRGRVHLGDGRTARGDAVVLALGIGRPAPLRAIDERLLGSDRYVADPWRPGALDGVGTDGPVLCVGSGLTAVDVVLSLSPAPIAPVTLVSRRGLLPAAHVAPAPAAPGPGPGPSAPTARALLRAVRRDLDEAAAAGRDWRSVVDGLRPHTARLWQGLPVDERCRLLRHAGRHWDVARHRMAPEVAARIDRLRAAGGLEVARGRVAAVAEVANGLDVLVRHAGGERVHRVGHLVNCTGPSADVTAAGHAVLDDLLATGRARTDPLRLGLDVDDDGAVLAADGRASGRLFAVGPLRRGNLWESTAVPEIRGQAAALAELLTNPDLSSQDYRLRVPA